MQRSCTLRVRLITAFRCSALPNRHPASHLPHLLPTVRATDRAGRVASSVSSSFSLDLTPPAFADDQVLDVTAAAAPTALTDDDNVFDLQPVVDAATGAVYTSIATHYDAQWFPARDPHSASTYTVSLHGPGLPLFLDRFGSEFVAGGGVDIGSRRSFHWHGLELEEGGCYSVHVTATNAAGLSTLAQSVGVIVDTTAPSGGFVVDGLAAGPEQDADYQGSEALFLEASWGDWEDDVSGVVKYAWTVRKDAPGSGLGGAGTGGPWEGSGSSHGSDRLLFDWADVGLNTTAFLDGAVLAPGVRYRVCLRVYNGAGLFAQVESDGVVVDGADPCLTGVLPGTEAGVVREAMPWRDSIEAVWRSAVDPALPSAKSVCNGSDDFVAPPPAAEGVDNATGSAAEIAVAPIDYFELQLSKLTPKNNSNVTFGLGFNNTIVNASSVNGTNATVANDTLTNVRVPTNDTDAVHVESPDPVAGFATVVMEYEQTGPLLAAPSGPCCSHYPVTNPDTVHPDFAWTPMANVPGYGQGDVEIVGVSVTHAEDGARTSLHAACACGC